MRRASLASAERLVGHGAGAPQCATNPRRMPKVLLLQFDTDPACGERRAVLAATGVTVVEAEPRWPSFFDVVTSERPDVIVIAASRISSHAYEAARYLGDGFNTRNIPVLLVDVSRKERPQAERNAPQSTIIERSDLAAAVEKVTSRALR
jgi:PleD family two-component response regulator